MKILGNNPQKVSKILEKKSVLRGIETEIVVKENELIQVSEDCMKLRVEKDTETKKLIELSKKIDTKIDDITKLTTSLRLLTKKKETIDADLPKMKVEYSKKRLDLSQLVEKLTNVTTEYNKMLEISKKLEDSTKVMDMQELKKIQTRRKVEKEHSEEINKAKKLLLGVEEKHKAMLLTTETVYKEAKLKGSVEGENIVFEAREEATKIREEVKKGLLATAKKQKDLDKKEKEINNRFEELDDLAETLNERKKEIKREEEDIEEKKNQALQEIYKVAKRHKVEKIKVDIKSLM